MPYPRIHPRLDENKLVHAPDGYPRPPTGIGLVNRAEGNQNCTESRLGVGPGKRATGL